MSKNRNSLSTFWFIAFVVSTFIFFIAHICKCYYSIYWLCCNLLASVVYFALVCGIALWDILGTWRLYSFDSLQIFQLTDWNVFVYLTFYLIFTIGALMTEISWQIEQMAINWRECSLDFHYLLFINFITLSIFNSMLILLFVSYFWQYLLEHQIIYFPWTTIFVINIT